MTTFESVEALWEEEHKTWRPHVSQDGVNEDARGDQAADEEVNPYLSSQMPATGSAAHSDGSDERANDDVEVDETMLSSQDITRLMEREEAEWHKEIDGHFDEIDEQYPEEEEEANEDGPPPDLQSEAGDAEERCSVCAATVAIYSSFSMAL